MYMLQDVSSVIQHAARDIIYIITVTRMQK